MKFFQDVKASDVEKFIGGAGALSFMMANFSNAAVATLNGMFVFLFNAALAGGIAFLFAKAGTFIYRKVKGPNVVDKKDQENENQAEATKEPEQGKSTSQQVENNSSMIPDFNLNNIQKNTQVNKN